MRKGNLFLGGGGDVPTAFMLDEKYFAMLRPNARILYIPIAMKKSRAEGCREWFSSLVAAHGRSKDVSFTMLLEDEPVPDFASYDALYFGGGNTYKLFDYIHSRDIGKGLVAYLKNGGIVFGGSAGAIIWGRSIKTAEDEKENYSRDDGLDFLHGLSIDCHYKPESDERLLALASRIVAMPENAGMIIDSDSRIVEMVGDVFLFDGHKKTPYKIGVP